jgi:hypothetical protein
MVNAGCGSLERSERLEACCEAHSKGHYYIVDYIWAMCLMLELNGMRFDADVAAKKVSCRCAHHHFLSHPSTLNSRTSVHASTFN